MTKIEQPPKTKPKWVFTFGAGHADGSAGDRNLLGGKGAYLAEMSRLGLPVPPGFTISTEVCAVYYERGENLPDELRPMVNDALDMVGKIAEAKFGDVENPLLVSVRSGSRASMPGMMDTVLNLGLNDQTVEGLARRSGDRRFAYDTYRRFIQMYADVVLGLDHELFEEILENFKNLKGLEYDTELSAEDWAELITRYKVVVKSELGEPFPQDLHAQLWGTIAAVFSSWQNARAIAYRRLHDIPDNWGTAVTIQAMVFGNRGDQSATGVVFTRNPSTGANELYGEYLVNAQGEDVVSGLRTPQPLTEAARRVSGSSRPSLEGLMPEAFAELKRACAKLEAHFRDLQDIEFTVQEGKLFMLQTRAGKRSTQAALKIAVDMAEQGVISREEAVAGIDSGQLDQLLHPTLDPDADRIVLAKGLPASPGAATGELVFDADEAVHLKAQGHTVILARVETSPEDVQGMHAAVGILTTRGGMTSHAAVVARGMGRPCVVGASARAYRPRARDAASRPHDPAQGRSPHYRRLDRADHQGPRADARAEDVGGFNTLMKWADGFRRMRVRANADTPADARQARAFGAEGIGLCRTEHMFFEENRILAMREMILAEDPEGRRKALAKLLPAAASGLHRPVRHHGWAAGHHPPARPAAARVPAAYRRGDRRGRRQHGSERTEAQAPRRRLERVQSDARSARCSAPRELSRDRRDAGARHLRSCDRSREVASLARHAGDHGAARRRQARARPRQGAHRLERARGREGARHERRLQRRHHGRAAASLPHGRGDRPERAVFLFWYQ